MMRNTLAHREFPAVTVQKLKRYGYSAMICMALFSMSTVLLFGSPTFAVAPATKTFDDYVYPVLIVLGIGLVWAILQGRIAVEKFERPLVLFGALFIAVKFGLTLLSSPTLLPLSHIESWYWMITGLWVASFLAYSFFPALYINLAVYASTLGVTITNAYLKADPVFVPDLLSDLAASNFRLAGSLIAIVVLGYVKHQWVHVENEAMLLRTIAHQDALTGLPNRRWLSRILQEAMNASDVLTLILFDLDRFKRINDRFGHNTGDDVLRAISSLAQQCVRATDTLGRWGGEEFLVVCPDTKLAEGVHLAERLRQMLANHPMHHGQTITGSFGVAQWQPGETAEQLIARADQALYTAKNQGKNQVCSSLVDRAVHPFPRVRASKLG